MKLCYTFLLTLCCCTLVKANFYYVTNTANSGPGSLQRAIISANANPGWDHIIMDIPGVGPHTINLSTPLPPLADATWIRGETQDGFAFPSGNSPAVIKVTINGAAMGAGSTGLRLGNNCQVSGLAIYGFATNLVVSGNNNRVYACHIGLDASGTLASGSTIDNVIVTGNNNTIGGDSDNRNVIAGAGNGVIIFPYTFGNRIVNNYIGTDATGNTTVSGNGFDGISISSDDNVVASNVIVGYESNNVLIGKWAADAPIPQRNQVLGNRIGHHADGSFSSFTNNCQGLSINNASHTRVSLNTIFGNGCHGVLIDGEEAIRNLVSENAIYGNGGIGINLGLDGVTPNDPGDGDTGPNELQNHPVLLDAKVKNFVTKVKGYIDTPNAETVSIEFYANSAPHATGYGSGQTLLGFTTPKSNGRIKATLPPLAPGTYISALAIDREDNTSEFSLSIEATAASAVATINPQLASVGMEEEEFQSSVFPNPFFHEAIITYQLPATQRVHLSVFNTTGQLIQVLKDEIQQEGTYRVQFEAQHLPAGIYYYRLLADGEIRTGRMVAQ